MTALDSTADLAPAPAFAPASPLGRREFLRWGLSASLATLGGVSAGARVSADDAPPPSRTSPAGRPVAPSADAIARGWIDSHSHVWTSDIDAYPLKPGRRKEEMRPASFTPAELLAHAEPAGVTRVVLIQSSFYELDNAYMLDAIREHPGRFSGVAIIDPEKRPGARMKELVAQGVRGYRLRPWDAPPDKWLDRAGIAEMWTTAADEGLAMTLLIDPPYLESAGKMCAKFPRTPVVIDHFARIGVDGEIRERDLAALCALAKHPLMHVKASAFGALGKKTAPYADLLPMVRRLCDAYGPDRLMWGTDCPYQVLDGHTYRDSVELIRTHADFLAAGDREWILRKTAEKVFW
ncbi:MAG: amidohydrolase family protein [Planctomycetaceae bacterium]